MTRTERATSPRAILRDRSESKSGYDKSLRKGGAGPHNWGAMRDEMELEREALEDAEFDSGELENLPSGVNFAVRPAVDGPSENSSKASTSSISEDEIEKAREFRAKGLKGNVDLGSIARTSAGASTSPPRTSALEVSRDAPTSSIPHA